MDRNCVERTFAKLKQKPRIATRFDRTTLSLELPQLFRNDVIIEVFYQHSLSPSPSFEPETPTGQKPKDGQS